MGEYYRGNLRGMLGVWPIAHIELSGGASTRKIFQNKHIC